MTPPVTAKDIHKEKWLHCSRCQATCLDRVLEPHQFLRCGRCGEEIKSPSGMAAIQAAWAFATTGLILMILASVIPQKGALFYGAMLICSILATDIYKPRMIWETATR